MDTHKPKLQPKEFLAAAQNYISAEKACGNLLASDVRQAESLYLRALIDDYKDPLPGSKTRTEMVSALILSRAKGRLNKIMQSSSLGQAALKSRK